MEDHHLELRTKISREKFAALHAAALSQELVKPIIAQTRGKNLEIKRSVYEILTPGQRALFAFWIVYGHTQAGWLQFYQEGLYVGGYEQFLPMIKAGLKRLDAQAMLENVVEAEMLYRKHSAWLLAAPDCRENSAAVEASLEQLQREFAPIDEGLFSAAAETLQKIETYIRAAPEEFVIFTQG